MSQVPTGSLTSHYGLVVGINRYPGIGDLTGARKDADAFAAWLTDPDGGRVPEDNVERICISEEKENQITAARGATPTNIEIDYGLQRVTSAVQAQLALDPSVWENTRLYFYVAGHGFAPQGNEGALFLANAEPGALARNIELVEYRKWCTSCAWFHEVVVFADCCRTRVESASRGFGPQLDECPSPWQNKASTWVIGFGSTLGKPTYEVRPGAAANDDSARGYFTAALLEGLRGGAPSDPEAGAITAGTLAGYVKSVVTARTRNEEFPQVADINGALGDQVLFPTPATRTARAVRIVFPGGFVGTARLLKDRAELATWTAGDGEWKIDLDDGLYEVAPVATGAAAFASDGLFKVAGEDRSVQL